MGRIACRRTAYLSGFLLLLLGPPTGCKKEGDSAVNTANMAANEALISVSGMTG
jgi:hypothetical protein